MTVVGVQLIDRAGRRRLLIIGALGMCFCEFIVAIVGVTAGKITVNNTVNLPAQKVLIAFVCLYVCVFFKRFVLMLICWVFFPFLIAILPSTLSLGDLLCGS